MGFHHHARGVALGPEWIGSMKLAGKTFGCWAASLGDCDGVLSGEHIVSDGALQKMISVQGFSWCKDLPRRIGAAKFTAKHLCERHNASLSRL